MNTSTRPIPRPAHRASPIAGALFACLLSACGEGYPTEETTETWTGTLAGVDADLRAGATGDDVRALNKYLSEVGYFPNATLADAYPAWRPLVAAPPADPFVFDAQTEAAVRIYQERNRLTVTGVADEPTRALMSRRHRSIPEGIVRLDPSDKLSTNGTHLGRRELTFKVTGGASTLTPGQVQAALTAATQTWAAHGSGISFRQITGSTNANVLFQFAATPFNQPMWINGQTISINPNFAWNMQEGSQYDLQTDAQFFLGWALGFSDSSYPDAQMNYGVPPTRKLHLDDKVVVTALYDNYIAEPTFTIKDIGVGANGEVWAISTLAVGGGNFHVAKRHPGGSWSFVADAVGGVRIAVEPSGVPWIVTANGDILRRNSNDTSAVGWKLMPNQARDIGIGGTSGMGHVWIAGKSPVNGGGQVFKFNGTSWTPTNGGAERLSVTNDGVPWLVAASGAVFRRTTADASLGSWEPLGGVLRDIGVGPMLPSLNGAVPITVAWSVANKSNGRANLSTFADQPNPYAKGWLSGTEISVNSALAVAVKPDGQPIVVDAAGRIWESPR